MTSYFPEPGSLRIVERAQPLGYLSEQAYSSTFLFKELACRITYSIKKKDNYFTTVEENGKFVSVDFYESV
jgi:hypothetical protein